VAARANHLCLSLWRGCGALADGFFASYLIWLLEGEPTLLVQLFNHVPNAQEVVVIEDVRWGGVDSAATTVAILQSLHMTDGTVGLVGRVPFQGYQTLAKGLPMWLYSTSGLINQTAETLKTAEKAN
jgi:hypothetical protein